jgi:outer membrane protein TolC
LESAIRLAADAALPAVQALAVLPADLLRNRPDIQSAEAAVEQAAAEVGVSRAALYPRLTLTGSLLYAYNLTRNHRTTSDSIPMIGPQIDIPLFDWGRRRAVADGKELALQASIKAYRQAVLNGIAEAESALAAVNSTNSAPSTGSGAGMVDGRPNCRSAASRT